MLNLKKKKKIEMKKNSIRNLKMWKMELIFLKLFKMEKICKIVFLSDNCTGKSNLS